MQDWFVFIRRGSTWSGYKSVSAPSEEIAADAIAREEKESEQRDSLTYLVFPADTAVQFNVRTDVMFVPERVNK